MANRWAANIKMEVSSWNGFRYSIEYQTIIIFCSYVVQLEAMIKRREFKIIVYYKFKIQNYNSCKKIDSEKADRPLLKIA